MEKGLFSRLLLMTTLISYAWMIASCASPPPPTARQPLAGTPASIPNTPLPDSSLPAKASVPTLIAGAPERYMHFASFYPPLLDLPTQPQGNKLNLAIPTTIFNFTTQRLIDSSVIEAVYRSADTFWAQGQILDYKFSGGRSIILRTKPRDVKSRNLVIVPDTGAPLYNSLPDQRAMTYIVTNTADNSRNAISIIRVHDSKNAKQNPALTDYRAVVTEIFQETIQVSAPGENEKLLQELFNNGLSSAMECVQHGMNYEQYKQYMSQIKNFGESALILSPDQYQKIHALGQVISMLMQIAPPDTRISLN